MIILNKIKIYFYLLFLIACAGEEKQDAFEDESVDSPFITQSIGRKPYIPPDHTIVITRSPDGNEMIAVPILLREATTKEQKEYGFMEGVNFSAQALSLNLTFAGASASAYEFSIADCKTGNSGTVTDSAGAANMYINDAGCHVKLNKFEISGIWYYPTAGDPFTTWAIADTAKFYGDSNANVSQDAGEPVVGVTYVSTVQNPVVEDDTIEILFAPITKGANSAVKDPVDGGTQNIWDNIAITSVNEYKLNMTISSIDFVGFDAVTGGIKLTVTLDCTIDVADGTGDAALELCDDVDMENDVDYKLVIDDGSTKSATENTLTYAEALTLFTVAGTDVVNGDLLGIGAGTTTHGGFITSTLTGPGPVHTASNNKMFLAIRASKDINADATPDLYSFLYFNIDVTKVSN